MFSNNANTCEKYDTIKNEEKEKELTPTSLKGSSIQDTAVKPARSCTLHIFVENHKYTKSDMSVKTLHCILKYQLKCWIDY